MRTVSKRLLAAGFAVSAALLAATHPPTAQDAKAFLDKADQQLLKLYIDVNHADWVHSTYITDDTELLASQADQRMNDVVAALAKQAAQFDSVTMPAELKRRMLLLKLGSTLPAPSDPKASEELSQLGSKLEGEYGKGKYCPPGGDASKCLDLEQITRIMASSRDEKQLREVWQGWHDVGRPMRNDYTRLVGLANQGSRELNFKDTGALWRSKYDMPPDAFAKELDRLWEQVKPLYVSLHAYVRWKLREKYGDVVPAKGPIPAHLLGNMWAQDWSNIYPLLAPENADPGYDLTKILKDRNTKPLDMVHYGESFFTSLGFQPLPKTFFERSLFTKPQDREVVCHASAWNVDMVQDLRIKMCIDITEEDFKTIHHELGHDFYYQAYNKAQPVYFRDSANDGFHEAVGDTIALSITPEYLVKIGLLDKAPDASKDTGLLLARALDKLAFLPFGLLVDQWRWKVFSGEITPAQYNAAWWTLRQKYQGIAAPVTRTEQDFDPGAKYHVASNTPYARYFLAAILQFQFHRALAQQSGCKDPLNRCSIYGNKEAGEKLIKMLSMGDSQPWPEELFALTGQRQMDATAIRDYFAPLQKWLDVQNQGKPVGW